MSIPKRAIKAVFSAAGLEVRRKHPLQPVSEPIKMPAYVHDILRPIESATDEKTTRAEILRKLRILGLTDFGLLLLSIPNPDFPKLSNLLPKMAAKEVQMAWTGQHGLTLLTQTVDFVRCISYNFTKLTGRAIQDADILDFGCGYGRIARLMYYFVDESRFYAVDPWDKSIEVCLTDGLTKNFFLSNFIPSTLPVGPVRFDLIFAFSVFTHLSERATVACLNTLAVYVKPGGVIVITIRPVEYWKHDVSASRLGLIEQQELKHYSRGFSFLPHDLSSSSPHNPDREPGNRDSDFGDTSITFDWLKNSFPRLRIVGLDRSLSDPLQIYVFMQKAED